MTRPGCTGGCARHIRSRPRAGSGPPGHTGHGLLVSTRTRGSPGAMGSHTGSTPPLAHVRRPGNRFAEHVTRRWLSGRSRLRALSLGCGPGDPEFEWARLGVFAQITSVGISPEQAVRATRKAREAGLDQLLTSRWPSARQALSEAEGHYDVVLALDSLHHFSRLGEIMRLIARALGPGGLLIMDEYVGPSRFQWASGQMRAANALLAALPEGHRTQHDGQVKRRVVRPSRLSMRLDDPSEAVESSSLMPALQRHFAFWRSIPTAVSCTWRCPASPATSWPRMIRHRPGRPAVPGRRGPGPGPPRARLHLCRLLRPGRPRARQARGPAPRSAQARI